MFGFRTVYLLSSLILFVSDRILGTSHSLYIPMIAVSLLGFIFGTRMLLQQTQIKWLALLGLSMPLAYVFWWTGSVDGQLWMNISEDALLQWQAFFQSLGVLCFFVSIIPIWALHNLLEQGDKHVSPSKIQHQTLLWLGTAMGLLALLPINYIAQDTNQRWDLGYFKTTSPGRIFHCIGSKSIRTHHGLSIFSNGHGCHRRSPHLLRSVAQ